MFTSEHTLFKSTFLSPLHSLFVASSYVSHFARATFVYSSHLLDQYYSFNKPSRVKMLIATTASLLFMYAWITTNHKDILV